MKVYMGHATDQGKYRKKNQDRVVCHCTGSREACLAVACVCDGIGSLEMSEIAAEIVTKGITRWFQGIRVYWPRIMGAEELTKDLEVTIRELNELVYDYRKEQGTAIGCTLSALLLAGQSYFVFHVGDSKIFRGREALCQITRDEVVMVEKDGIIKPHLANYIGRSRELWISRLAGTIREGELFLLGSDGLFGRLEEGDTVGLRERARSGNRAQRACDTLLKKVRARGERDNVSCILVNVFC